MMDLMSFGTRGDVTCGRFFFQLQQSLYATVKRSGMFSDNGRGTKCQ
jgi:hypothetical protein